MDWSFLLLDTDGFIQVAYFKPTVILTVLDYFVPICFSFKHEQ